MKRAILILVFFLLTQPLRAAPLPPTIFQTANDYTFSSWLYGIRSPSRTLTFRTSRYAAKFDITTLALTHLLKLDHPLDQHAALLDPDQNLFPDKPNTALTLSFLADGKILTPSGGSPLLDDTQLIESGQYLQHRILTHLQWNSPLIESSALEISAWPDRFSFIFRLTPATDLDAGALTINIQIPPGFHAATNNPSVSLFRFNKDHIQLTLPTRDWPAHVERFIALVLTTDPDPDENRPTLTARQFAPLDAPLSVSYNPWLAAEEVTLRNDPPSDQATPEGRHRLIRVHLELTNPDKIPRTIRIIFIHDKPGFEIRGLSAILRDADAFPTGIPIQLSKNWHTEKQEIYRGPWSHNILFLTLPANSTIPLEYTEASALWGNNFAASIAQLCLIGWGSNQQWDQAAIGSFGENICFEPDAAQTNSFITDTRPLLITSMHNHQKYDWTINVGGADFLAYYPTENTRIFPINLKTFYQDQCPLLTTTTYAGQTADRNITLQYTTHLYSSDDITRGLYHFHYDILKPTPFSRLVFFQAGADGYSYTGEKQFTLGNETGPLKTWNTQWGGNTYRTPPIELTGQTPWISMHQAVPRDPSQAWANRGLILRHWSAQLNGKPAQPYIAERGQNVNGTDTSLIDFVPPPDIHQLEPGDFVDAELEHLVIPQYAKDYYGPNTDFAAALKAHEDTAYMVQREALGNTIQCAITIGKILRSRPLEIQSQNNTADFTLNGGVGQIPLTITNLNSYRTPQLQLQTPTGWHTIDQSIHGNDFWQTTYDPATKSFRITYTIPAAKTPQHLHFSLSPL